MLVLAPTTATGLLRSAASALGRDAQSIAFLSCPGIEELYSGVANRTASAASIAARHRSTSDPGEASSSSSNSGICLSPSYLADLVLAALDPELVLYQRRVLGLSRGELNEGWAQLVESL